MDSLGGVVTILAAPIFGLLGVWLGGFLQARKDDARWLRERDRENERWRREDSARWLREQHELYAAAISAVERLRQVSRRAFHPHPSTAGQPGDVLAALRETIPGLTTSAHDAVEAIGVLGTEEVYNSASTAISSLQMMAYEARTLDASEAYSALQRRYKEASEATNQMRAAIRAELGIGGPSPLTGSAWTD